MLRRACVEVFYWVAVRGGLGTQVARGASAAAMDSAAAREPVPPSHLFFVLLSALAGATVGASPEPNPPGAPPNPGVYVPLRDVFLGLGCVESWDRAQPLPEAIAVMEVRVVHRWRID
jgi:hypothetical protein